MIIFIILLSLIFKDQNLPDTMIKCSDGTFEEVLKEQVAQSMNIKLEFCRIEFLKEEEQEEDSFNKGDGDDN